MTAAAAPSAPLTERIADFLDQRRIAVVGLSSDRDLPGNLIYRKLKSAGYEVVAIIPDATSFDGDPCYPDVGAVPFALDGLVVATRPAVTTDVVRQAVAAGVPRIWMHESLMHGGTSVSEDAVELCRARGVALIAGACPMMYCEPVDLAHRCMCWLMRVTGGLPE